MTSKLSLKEAPIEARKAPVRLASRAAKQITAVLITATRNSQGEDNKPAYCLAAVAGNRDGCPRLIRLVPDMGHFWTDEMLPRELRDIHRHKHALSDEPEWPFQPVVVGFEAGTLPDIVTGPHANDDVVARKLEFIGEVEEHHNLHQHLHYLAYDRVEECWPDKVWATHKGLHPEAEVPSLALFCGEIKWVYWRGDMSSPAIDIDIDGKVLKMLPFAAHRLHSDKGYKMLQWMQERKSCLILLGLSRTFVVDGVASCPILVLRVFPSY